MNKYNESSGFRPECNESKIKGLSCNEIKTKMTFYLTFTHIEFLNRGHYLVKEQTSSVPYPQSGAAPRRTCVFLSMPSPQKLEESLPEGCNQCHVGLVNVLDPSSVDKGLLQGLVRRPGVERRSLPSISPSLQLQLLNLFEKKIN